MQNCRSEKKKKKKKEKEKENKRKRKTKRKGEGITNIQAWRQHSDFQSSIIQ